MSEGKNPFLGGSPQFIQIFIESIFVAEAGQVVTIVISTTKQIFGFRVDWHGSCNTITTQPLAISFVRAV
jgi:hypothetical protein